MNNKPMWHYDKRVQKGDAHKQKKLEKELIPPSKLQNNAQKT
jgi:hypothetical protein